MEVQALGAQLLVASQSRNQPQVPSEASPGSVFENLHLLQHQLPHQFPGAPAESVQAFATLLGQMGPALAHLQATSAAAAEAQQAQALQAAVQSQVQQPPAPPQAVPQAQPAPNAPPPAQYIPGDDEEGDATMEAASGEGAPPTLALARIKARTAKQAAENLSKVTKSHLKTKSGQWPSQSSGAKPGQVDDDGEEMPLPEQTPPPDSQSAPTAPASPVPDGGQRL